MSIFSNAGEVGHYSLILEEDYFWFLGFVVDFFLSSVLQFLQLPDYFVGRYKAPNHSVG